MDGQSPSPGWSPTIQNLPEGRVLQTWNLAHRLNSQNQDQATTAIDGQPPSYAFGYCTTEIKKKQKLILVSFKKKKEFRTKGRFLVFMTEMSWDPLCTDLIPVNRG